MTEGLPRFIQITKRSAGGRTNTGNMPLDLTALTYGQQHLPLVEGMSQAQWLAIELDENGGVYETNRGMPAGATIRFEYVSMNKQKETGDMEECTNPSIGAANPVM